jgi:hypothetical protein
MKSFYTRILTRTFLAGILLLGVFFQQKASAQTPGNALNFDGVNDYAKAIAPVKDDFTIEFWMRTTQTGAGSVGGQWYTGTGLVDADVIGQAKDFGVSLLGSKICFGTGDGVNDVSVSSFSNVNTGNWVHVALVRVLSSGKIKIFINGVVEDSAAAGKLPLTDAYNNNLVIGANTDLGSTKFYNGDIDELRIFNTDRSADIAGDMLNSVTASATGLVTWYNFDQGTAGGVNTSITSLTDMSPQGNNASLTNFNLTGPVSNFIQSYYIVNTGTKIAAASNITGSGFTANWSAPVNDTINDYYVAVSTDSFFTNIALRALQVTGPATSAIVTGLSPATKYYYRVKPGNTPTFVRVYSDSAPVTTGPADTGLGAITISGTTSICPGGTTTLTASGAGGATFDWYDAPSGGNWLGSSASYTTQALTSTTTYYVQQTAGGNTSTRTAVTVTVNPLLAVSAGGNITVSAGSSVTLTATGGDNYSWSYPYNLSAASITFTPSATSTWVVTGTLAGGCSSTNSTVVTVTPVVSVTGNTTVCPGSTTTLTASGTPPFTWYGSQTGGTVLYTGSAFTTPAIKGDTTFWVADNTGTRVPVNISVTQALQYPAISTPPGVCIGSSAALQLQGFTQTINWYNNAQGDSLIGTTTNGNALTVTPAANTVYYAKIQAGTLPDTVTFNYTGGVQTFTVPAGVTSIQVDARGGRGGYESELYGYGHPGFGGRVQATMSVQPGEVLNIYVGQRGYGDPSCDPCSPYPPSFNGGGAGTENENGGGGGATDIRINGQALNNRVLVAGGGGGTSNDFGHFADFFGGSGGGLVGADGQYGGSGGSQTAGGSVNGALGNGGAGTENSGVWGSGGGGGFFGGGGAPFRGGGAGGSSYTNPALFQNVVHTQGFQSTDGSLYIIYNAAQECIAGFTIADTVTVLHPTSSTTFDTICSSYLPFKWNDSSFATAGTYTLHLTNKAGCDSAATLVLTVNLSDSSTTNVTVGYLQLPYTWNGNAYTAGGTYHVHLPATQACDSVATLVLTVTLSASPSSGGTGTNVTIHGAYFTGATAVTFGGYPVTSFTVINDSTIIAVASAGGTGDIVVTTPIGTYIIPSGFTYVAPPQPPGNALSFDGVADKITIQNPLSGSYTIEYWMRTTQTGSTGAQWYNGSGIVDGDIGGAANDLGTSLLGTKLAFGTGNPASSGDVTIRSKSDVNTGKWVFVAVTRNAATGLMKLYINGVAEDSTIGGMEVLAANSTLTMGAHNAGGNFFRGSIDEVRLFNTDRSTYIKSDMVDTLSRRTEGVAAYYNFDEGTAGGTNTNVTTLVDIGPGNINGTLQNFALTGSTGNWVESYASVVPGTAAPGSVEGHSFTANWTAPAVGAVDNYLLDVATDPLFTNTVAGYNALAVTATSQNITGLTGGTRYWYRVRANKASVAGQGVYSDTTSITTLPAAVVTSFIPTNGITGSTVTVKGRNFTGTSGVSFGEAGAASFTVVNDSVITAVVGAGTTGNIAITGPFGTTASADTFTFIPQATITSISPAIANTYQTITIKGAGFTAATGVDFGGTPAASFTIVNDSVITAVVGAGASGDVTVTATGNTATLAAGFTFITLTPPGNTLNFDGSNDYVKIPANPVQGNDFTIEFWMKTIQTGNGGSQWYQGNGIIDADVPGAANDYGISLLGSKLAFGTGGGNDVTITSRSDVNTGHWVHVAVVRSQATDSIKLYINGVLEAKALTDAATLNAPLFAIIGSTTDLARYFNGSIDELRFFNTDRGAGIMADMLNTASPSAPGLASYYNFDEGLAGSTNNGAATLADIGPNGINADLHNFGLTGGSSNWVESYAMAVPTLAAPSAVTDSSFTVNWSAPAVGTVDNYLLDVATDSLFNNLLPGYNALPVPGLYQPITGLNQGGVYWYRVQATKTSVAGQGGYSATGKIVLPANALVISSFSPLSAGSSATITIKGKYFTNAVSVTFGGTPATSFNVVSDSVITAVTGSGSSGYVTVSNANYADSATGFSYIAPVITFVTPSTGSLGNTIAIKGKYFTGATGVSLGGVNIVYTVLCDTVINAVITSGAPGNLAVATPNGTATYAGFTYISQPPPGNALNFTGSNYVSTPATNVQYAAFFNYTVEVWVRPANAPAMGILSTSGSNAEPNFNLYMQGGNLYADIGDGFSGYLNSSEQVGAFNFVPGHWYHIAIVVSRGSYTCYVNGKVSGTGSVRGFANFFGSQPLLIGQSPLSNTGAAVGGFMGDIDEVRVWNYAATPAQVQADMTGAVTNPSTNSKLLLYYNFDNLGIAGGNNPVSTSVTDLSQYASTATLNGFALTGDTSNWTESYAMVIPPVAPATNITASGFTANWGAPATGIVSNYVLDVATDAAFTNLVQGYSSLMVNATSQAVTGLAQQTKYYYRVRADKTSVPGEGAYSDTISATTTATPPVVTSFTPTSAHSFDTVTITGANLLTTSAVTFGGKAAISFTVLSDTVVKAVVANGLSGSIVITAPGGTDTLQGFTYLKTNLAPPGNALSFDGVDDHVSLTNPLGLAGNYTVEFWMRTTQSNAGGTNWYQGNGLVDGDLFGLQPDFGTALLGTKLAFGAGNVAGNTDVTIQSKSDVNTGRWVFVAATRNASTGLMKLYINGMAEDSAIAGIAPLAANSSLTIGGSNGGGGFFQGEIDEVRMFKTDRSASITADMADTISTTVTGLAAYFNFDEGTAGAANTNINRLLDQSANNITGTLNNFSLSGPNSNWVESYAMAVPAALQASGIAGSAFTANWAAPAVGTADNYLLDVATDSAFSSILPAYNSKTVNGTFANVTGLTQGTKYYYRVRADKASITGQGGYSGVIVVTTGDLVVICSTALPYTWNGNHFRSAGTYTVHLTNQYGLDSIATLVLQVSTPVTATLTGALTQVCYNASTTVTVTPSGGIRPFLYSINGGTTWQSSDSFTVHAGAYHAAVKDSAGCRSASNTITITQPAAPLALSVTSSRVNCINSVALTASGGFGSYTYSQGGAYQAANSFTGLTPGGHSFAVQDANGCTTGRSVAITGNIFAANYAAVKTQLCTGSATSSTVIATGGTKPYTYSIDNGANYQTGAVFKITAGTYSIIVQDATGCQVTTNTVTANQPAQPLQLSAAVALQNCTTASIALTASGGYGGYTFSNQFGSYQANNIFSGLDTGLYHVSVQDANGCVVNKSLPAGAQKPLSATYKAGRQIACYGKNVASTIYPAGGIKPYEYSINDGAAYQPGSTFVVMPGSYTAKVMDSAGCVTTTNTITINQETSPLHIALVNTSESCLGANNGTITVTAGGGLPGYMYKLSTGAAYQNSNMFNNLAPATDTLQVIDSAGCTITARVIIKPGPVCSSISATQPVTTDATQGKSLAIKVLPNPTLTDFNLTVTSGDETRVVELRVINMIGQEVYHSRGAVHHSFIFGSGFANGMYIAEVLNGDNVQRIKLVKGN